MRGKVRDRILRVLLNHPSGDVSKYWIAKQASCTYPWAREFFLKLAKMGLVEGTRVIDYSGLLHYWQSVSPKPRYKEYMVKEPLNVLKDAPLPYALTTYQAETLVQNHLFPSRVDIRVREGDSGQWHDLLSKKGLVGGGNVLLLLSDEHVFYKSFETEGLRIVSLPQLIVDLLSEGGVCVEAAEMLIKGVQKRV